MVSSSSLSWLVVEAITTFFAVLGGLMVEYKTNVINLTNSTSGIPAKWYISNF